MTGRSSQPHVHHHVPFLAVIAAYRRLFLCVFRLRFLQSLQFLLHHPTLLPSFLIETLFIPILAVIAHGSTLQTSSHKL